jgi:hypothetical protein
MEMVSIHNNKNNLREVKTYRFIALQTKPLIATISLASTIYYFLRNVSKVTLNTLGIDYKLSIHPWFIRLFISLILSYYAMLIIFKFIGKERLLLPNTYYLVPSFIIKFVAMIGYCHKGSADNIPTWQYIDYLYNNWARLSIDVPEVIDASKDTSIKVSEIKSDAENDKILSIIISDTYPINLDTLPSTVKNHSYVVLQTMINGKVNLGRRAYNPELVKLFIDQVNKSKENSITAIQLLSNTNPKHIKEIMREAFCNAGRSHIKHLVVYENPRKNNYNFTKRHNIF